MCYKQTENNDWKSGAGSGTETKQNFFQEDNPRNMNSRCKFKKAFSISSMEKTRKILHLKLGST